MIQDSNPSHGSPEANMINATDTSQHVIQIDQERRSFIYEIVDEIDYH